MNEGVYNKMILAISTGFYMSHHKIMRVHDLYSVYFFFFFQYTLIHLASALNSSHGQLQPNLSSTNFRQNLLLLNMLSQTTRVKAKSH